MLFRRNVLEAIARGDVTIAFRRWRRPTVRAGGRLRTSVGTLAIKSVEEVSLGDITEPTARAAGYDSLTEARHHLAGPVGRMYRISFQLVGDDPRVALRSNAVVTHAEFENVAASLKRLDRRAPWTRNVLELIRKKPGTHAQALADELGFERQAFKRRVRQLKELGLTESLPVGYKLSPRGISVLKHLDPIAMT